MTTPTIRRVPVWSGWLRLAHWSMAASVVALLFTGWLIRIAPAVSAAALDYHYIAGYGLAGALVLRFYLLVFGRGAEYWQGLWPDRTQRRALLEMVRFYVSFGRTPLPHWYAHNPFWAPIYLLLFVLLALQLASGLSLDAPYLLAGRSIPALHGLGAKLIGGFVVLHVMAVFLHDLKGTNSDVSAMINGHRIFVVDKPASPLKGSVHTVSLDELMRSRKGDGS